MALFKTPTVTITSTTSSPLRHQLKNQHSSPFLPPNHSLPLTITGKFSSVPLHANPTFLNTGLQQHNQVKTKRIQHLDSSASFLLGQLHKKEILLHLLQARHHLPPLLLSSSMILSQTLHVRHQQSNTPAKEQKECPLKVVVRTRLVSLGLIVRRSKTR